VLFDQRGSGDSTPASSLVDNTTQHLIEDIETIREHLQVGASWHVFGGSWGESGRVGCGIGRGGEEGLIAYECPHQDQR
jgi:pimeloyl-ACP methyl ester carboxylesterase